MDEIEKLLQSEEELKKIQNQALKASNPWNKEINIVRGSKPEPEVKNVIKGVTEHINTKEVQPLLKGSDFQAKIQKILASRAASKGLKALPFIGPAIGAMSALSSGDVSAAIPVLDQIESTGPKAGSIDKMIEDGTITPDQLDAIKRSRGL